MWMPGGSAPRSWDPDVCGGGHCQAVLVPQDLRGGSYRAGTQVSGEQTLLALVMVPQELRGGTPTELGLTPLKNGHFQAVLVSELRWSLHETETQTSED